MLAGLPGVLVGKGLGRKLWFTEASLVGLTCCDDFNSCANRNGLEKVGLRCQTVVISAVLVSLDRRVPTLPGAFLKQTEERTFRGENQMYVNESKDFLTV